MNRIINISRYIGIHVATLITLLVLVYSITIEKVYQWGVYDTTHYFLSVKAEQIFETNDHLSTDTESLAQQKLNYYSDKSQLPDLYRELLIDEKSEDGDMLVHQSGGLFYYLLPVLNPETNTFFYITSNYDADNDPYEVSLDIPELQILLALIALLLVLYLIKKLTWSVVKSIQKLEEWACLISNDNDEKRILSPITLRFAELNSVAKKLYQAVCTIEENNIKEKRFLKTLSHELRTPLTTTKMAVDLLQKKPLQKAVEVKVERIQRANNSMLATADCLLWLWSNRKTHIQARDVSLLSITHEVLSSNQYLVKNKLIDIVIEVPPELTLYTEKSLLKIVLNNLIRNALQYTYNGQVKISVSDNALRICNSLSYLNNETACQANEESYGYGIGLNLVKEICKQKKWLMQVNQSQEHFSVLVQFNTDESV